MCHCATWSQVTQRTIAITFSLRKLEPTSGTAVLVDRTVSSRISRALMALFGAWLAAVPCVFIPLLHFLLVPGLLIAGGVFFVKRLREDVSLLEIHAACPRCMVPRTFICGGRWYEGRAIHCDGCGDQPQLRSRSEPSLSTVS